MKKCTHQRLTPVGMVDFKTYHFDVLALCMVCGKRVGVTWQVLFGDPSPNNLDAMYTYTCVLSRLYFDKLK